MGSTDKGDEKMGSMYQECKFDINERLSLIYLLTQIALFYRIRYRCIVDINLRY